MQQIKNILNTEGNKTLTRVAYLVVAVFIFVDLVRKIPEGPVMYVFFPQLYFWGFALFAVYLMWITVKAMEARIWRITLVAIFAAASALAVFGAPDVFPFYAPGQDEHHVEGQKGRVKKIDKIETYIGGVEVRPASFDNRIDVAVLWLKVRYKEFFRNLVGNILKAMVPLKKGLQEMPMWIFTGMVCLIAWRVTSYKVAIGSAAGLLFIAVFDLWSGTMVTITVVGGATFLSIMLAVPIGIGMSKSDGFQSFMKPMLDMAQTMPSFVYLIPAIFFLGIGMVPAVFATIIYAVPPGIRLTNLGIRLVSPELKETAMSFGTTPWQLLVKVELPLARPTIMAGINQTVMMALAMVVIATLVGAGGLGADVYAGVQQLEFGRGLMGGIAIVILAVIIDRISQGFAKDPTASRED
jgi:glycine betaine/proline transport system permease protein